MAAKIIDSILDNYKINYLYHMTHISNLDSILKNGLLANGNPLQKKDISNREVNNRRDSREPVYGKSIHSYVPFYFNPKNAMLYVRQNMQNDIVILTLSRDIIFSENAIFTDGNASCQNTRFFKDLNSLNQLHWSCIFGATWYSYPDGKRVRMAEVLVPNRVESSNIIKIKCNNIDTFNKIPKKYNPEIDRNFYF